MNQDAPEERPSGLRSLFTQAPQLERHGISRIPEEERTQSPWSFFFMAVGSSFSLGFVAFGWLPIVLGLGLWDSVSSIIVGITAGCILIAPLIVIGLRTATNNTTTSIAFFGVRGRVLGTIVILSVAIMYTSIAVWVGVDAIFASIGRLSGSEASTTGMYVAYGLLTLFVAFIAIYGYNLMLRFETALAVVGAILLLLSLIAVGGDMDLTYAGGDYILAGRWQTWLLSCVVAGISGPMAFVGLTGDWTRYISDKRYSAWKVVAPSIGGIWLGLVAPMLIGTFTTVAFVDPYADYAFGLVDASPTWYVVIILILGILATGASAVTTTYSSGLGLQTITPRLTRFSTTMITAVASGVLIYLGAIYSGLADVILAATLITLVVTTPWAVVILLGHWLNKGRYNFYDLTRIVRGESGGIYWCTGGWNLRGTAALVIGSFFGIMAVQAPPIITGPWANIAGGVDVSFLGAAVVSAVVYLVLRWVFPEAEIAEEAGPEPAVDASAGS